ncbi:MAG: lytic transglycosylase domain-containing protein [Solirubrobacterales bacterium]
MSAAARGRAKSPPRKRRAPASAKKRSGAARSKRKRGAAAAKVRRRRWIVGGGAAAVVAAIGISQLGMFDETIREVTLPLRHEDIIRQQAAEKEVDADLIAAVIYAESRFVDQTSHADARGLMQVTPDTAAGIAQRSGGTTFDPETDLSDPQINIQYGTYYLDELLTQYGGNEVAALAAYNAGPGNADAWGGAELEAENIEFAETREYVKSVLSKRDEYRANYARELGLD